jgi:tol-pal system protein YbgF
MQNSSAIRPRLVAALVVAVLLAFTPAKGRAESKDMIELKQQVSQLIDMVQRLQSTVDSRMGILQHLVEQTADNSNRVSAAMDDLQRKIATQNEALSGKVDASSGQMQSVNDSVDEVKARLAKLERSIQDLQTQIQSAQQQQQQQQQPAAGSGGNAGGGAVPAPTQGDSGGGGNSGGGGAPSANAAPPLQETYQSGVRDYNSGKYQVAQGEFQDVIQYYPQDDMAGGAQFYLGEIAFKSQDYGAAVKAFNVVLESFPSSTKAPAAQLHKGFALLLQNKRDAGIHELRSLIQRHPNSPEAMQARSRLNGMGVRITASAPQPHQNPD